ncbi:hypothetical protein ACLOJK_022573 [Asimina triloba]
MEETLPLMMDAPYWNRDVMAHWNAEAGRMRSPLLPRLGGSGTAAMDALKELLLGLDIPLLLKTEVEDAHHYSMLIEFGMTCCHQRDLELCGLIAAII